MKLSPVEILKHLGFEVPADGVEISPHNAYFMTAALQFAGQTIDPDRLPAPLPIILRSYFNFRQCDSRLETGVRGAGDRG